VPTIRLEIVPTRRFPEACIFDKDLPHTGRGFGAFCWSSGVMVIRKPLDTYDPGRRSGAYPNRNAAIRRFAWRPNRILASCKDLRTFSKSTISRHSLQAAGGLVLVCGLGTCRSPAQALPQRVHEACAAVARETTRAECKDNFSLRGPGTIAISLRCSPWTIPARMPS
jgi:hypothetical protein